MQRLSPIEGLRAYLAFWVIFTHAAESSGYRYFELNGFVGLLAEGRWAVDVFVIISGFVIFFLLDNQREPYGAFITRRFFRLFPLAFLLFLVAIPLSKLRAWNIVHGGYLHPETASILLANLNAWWAQLPLHTALHATLLHGLVPQFLVTDAPSAFLDPAWSISLEWQFYLVAPFVYRWSARPGLRIAVCAGSAALFLAAQFLPKVSHGAALPFHSELFFVGALSYFFYKKHREGISGALLVGACLAFFLFLKGNREHALIPVCLWLTFLGLLLEPSRSISSKALLPLFNHPVALFLGKISYSIYLSHFLAIFVIQFALIALSPGLPQKTHFLILLLLTTAITIPVSALLYRWVEKPGIRLGKRLAERKTAASNA